MIDSMLNTLDVSRFMIKRDWFVDFLADFFAGLVSHPIVLLAISQKYL